MAYYRSTDRKDRAKALAGVLLVHAALGVLILSGLSVRTVGEAVQRLQTFNISKDPPPPPAVEPPPPPRPEDSSAPRDEAAPANIRSRPTPVVAPTPPIPLPLEQRINTAQVPGPEGLDRTAGASNQPGAGTGAGGAGTGFGGGGRGGTGAGDGQGIASGPRLLSGAPTKGDYRRLGARISGRAQAVARLTIDPNGRVANCAVVRSTGYPDVDARICPLLQTRMRWEPMRNRAGEPMTSWLNYVLDFTRY
jgi:protein TonB